MSKTNDGQPSGECTREFKLEAAWLVKGGQAAVIVKSGVQ